jgi:hypothetical protein
VDLETSPPRGASGNHRIPRHRDSMQNYRMNDAEIIERLTAELKDALFVFMELERLRPGEYSETVTPIRSAILHI